MTSLRSWAFSAGITCAAAFLFAACGGDEKPSDEAAESAATAEDDELADIPRDQIANIETGENGEIRYVGETAPGEPFVAQMGGDVDVPEGFFDDFPLYPEAEARSVLDAKNVQTVTAIAQAEASDIYEFYKTKLSDGGWELESDFNVSGGGRVLNFIRDGRRTVVHIYSGDDGTRIGFMRAAIE